MNDTHGIVAAVVRPDCIQYPSSPRAIVSSASAPLKQNKCPCPWVHMSTALLVNMVTQLLGKGLGRDRLYLIWSIAVLKKKKVHHTGFPLNWF